MKQFNFSVLMSLMLCVLIGYFEPANATKVSKSLISAADEKGAYMVLNTIDNACPFWPNPVAPGATVTTISIADEIITGGLLQSVVENNQYFVPIIGVGWPFPADVVENNQYFVPDVVENNQYFVPDLVGTGLSIPSDAKDGNYVLVITTKSGNKYWTKISISSN